MNRALRQRRIALGLTQEQLAQEAGIDRTTVNKIENGASCSLAVALRICKILNATVEELFSHLVHEGARSA